MIHDILLYCTLHMQGLWSFSFLGCSSWLLLCRLHVWWGMWGPTRGFFQRRRIMSHSAAGTSNVTWYKTRGLDISSEMWSLLYCTVQLKMKRSSQSKVYEKDVWGIQVDSLSETRYTVSVFDIKRLNPSLSRLDLIWFELLVRPASGERGLWVQCMVTADPKFSFIYTWTYIYRSWYSTQPSGFVSYFVLSIDQTYTTSEKGVCGVRALEVPELQTMEVEN